MPQHYLFRVKSFFGHLLTARTRYSIHSPFLYHFICQVLNDNYQYDDYLDVEGFREKIAYDRSWFKKMDLGAKGEGRESIIQVSSEVDKITIPSKYGQLLYRTIRYFGLRYALELGTGFGIGSAYLMKGLQANRKSKLITIEGCPETSNITRKYLENLREENPGTELIMVEGAFEDHLKNALNSIKEIDFLLMDGHHKKEPVIRNFNTVLPYMNNSGVIAIDDINWSPEMKSAWETIIQNSNVSMTVDLYRMGLIFLSPSLPKSSFKIRF